MPYELTDHDRTTVLNITDAVTPEAVPGLVAIHRHHISVGEQRRATLVEQLEATERALAMRRLSIEHLEAVLSASQDEQHQGGTHV